VIAFDEALAIVAAAARPLGKERVALDGAAGRVLADPVIARVDSPPADVSAMDGYAVREGDLGAASRLRVIGAAYPGAPFETPPGPAQCVRIFTGAPLPPGTDRVIVQENVRRDGDDAVIATPPSATRHIRARGADFRAGDRLLDAGLRLDPRAMVAAAGADVAELGVWRRPRLIVLGTGDELVEPGAARDRPQSIPESVSFGVGALAEAWGAELIARRRLKDDIAAMEAAAAAALEAADLVIVAGGASVGEKDYAKRVFSALGTALLFSKVAIKPGKPVWFGRAGDRLVLGLPGNPTSAMVTARLFLMPLLAGMSGRDPAGAVRWRPMRLAAPLPLTGDRETFVRASQTQDGATPLSNQDSGMQLALVRADLLIRRRPHAPALDAGAEIEAIDF
jgi:molybdopterin molybdotransferase